MFPGKDKRSHITLKGWFGRATTDVFCGEEVSTLLVVIVVLVVVIVVVVVAGVVTVIIAMMGVGVGL